MRVYVYMWTRRVPALLPCPTRLNMGKRPSGVVMADQAWRWRPHTAVRVRLAKWVDRTSATDQHTDWPHRTHSAWGSGVRLTWSASHRMTHWDTRLFLRWISQTQENILDRGVIAHFNLCTGRFGLESIWDSYCVLCFNISFKPLYCVSMFCLFLFLTFIFIFHVLMV